MDSAKFCGNCGNAFSRSSDQTSSLINCPQGHIYSAVYQHCPYCPQPEGNDASSFITRVEEPVTAIDPFSAITAPSPSSQMDYATRVETNESMFETLDSPVVNPPAPEDPAPPLAPTEVITTLPAFEPLVESFKPWEERSESTSPSADLSLPESVLKPSAEQAVLASTPPPPAETVKSAQSVSSGLSTSTTPDGDRRTIIMAEQAAPVRAARGKIVGWLISYNRNPDGEDYRIYAGYNRIGANPVCDILIDDETVSGSHAIIVYRDGRCLIKDDLSRNGTFVNGREITEAHTLQNYDQVRVGNTHLTYVSAQRT
ncbi:MAG: FHA domain-containing protein [Acidobacteria bacterium]|nr:FHA domain-containing protein [Acidobacteriota bacterium]